VTLADRSGGYERMAREFVRSRGQAEIGATTVREWTHALRPRGTVLDVGCGHGVPISQVLVAEGFDIYGVDASPTMIAEFKARFPRARAQCSPVEDSALFGRTFDGVVAWGLMFLLSPEGQELVIGKVSRALVNGGRFLFTSPCRACTWTDILTGARSVSLGREKYREILVAEGLDLIGETADEGQNYYYFASKG
jgi:cyclopropane fatty-acyl-phospholipid synthase-like methyltransferase